MRITKSVWARVELFLAYAVAVESRKDGSCRVGVSEMSFCFSHGRKRANALDSVAALEGC